MGKIAFLFPGQGAQVVGMGKDFYDEYSVAKEVFNISSEATGLDIQEICFTENENINITEYTQAALLTTEVAILRTIEKMGIKGSKKTKTGYSTNVDVLEKLKETLAEMTDPTRDFRRTTSAKTCGYCDFRNICGR